MKQLMLMFFVVITLLSIIKPSAAEEMSHLARQRQRILHHRYPQVFRYKPESPGVEPRRRGGYRPHRPHQTFELPDETRQPWVPQRKMPHDRRPADTYGSPPADWPMRPPVEREQPSPHDIYGPPVEMPDPWDDDVRERGFRNDYEYEQYPEDEFQEVQERKRPQQKSSILKSDQYVGEEMQQKMPRDDRIENFEIPLELLRIPQGS